MYRGKYFNKNNIRNVLVLKPQKKLDTEIFVKLRTLLFLPWFISWGDPTPRAQIPVLDPPPPYGVVGGAEYPFPMLGSAKTFQDTRSVWTQLSQRTTSAPSSTNLA